MNRRLLRQNGSGTTGITFKDVQKVRKALCCYKAGIVNMYGVGVLY
jgi:hypothetical protein